MNEKLKRQLLASLSASHSMADVHPNADDLAAFRERSLPASSRVRVAAHLATCAECRDVLWLSIPVSDDPRRVRTPVTAYILYLAAAAALVLLFAGTTSIMDDGVISRGLSEIHGMIALTHDAAARQPKVAYASAEIKLPGASFRWRIRASANAGVLEFSPDSGKTWRMAKIDRPFTPEAVGFSGMDVWVKSRSGEMLLSRDAGLHWTPWQSVDRR